MICLLAFYVLFYHPGLFLSADLARGLTSCERYATAACNAFTERAGMPSLE